MSQIVEKGRDGEKYGKLDNVHSKKNNELVILTQVTCSSEVCPGIGLKCVAKNGLSEIKLK